MKTPHKETNELIRAVQAQGWTVRRRRNHIQFCGPNGEIVMTASTPSDHRALKNTKAWLRRHGCEVA